ncbi:39S ribosomal protein L12, mitochondrial-like [Mya arenaria]|uniref:39S ribosomal protein L12, mitochondrial-like n=1 Tax=Mya arenaria TaxID=6604 RepID=UPI0022E3DB37|nr:39S ribosomal protein L12, mitochondrial-like [Mya arenaria]
MKSSTMQALKLVLRTSSCSCRHRSPGMLKTMRSLESLQRCFSTEPQEKPLPLPNTPEKTYSPKIQQIVTDISQLTLLEVSDLNELLKKTLNIADAPVMAVGAMPTGAGSGFAAGKQEEEEEAEPVKMSYTVKLDSFTPEKKVALIKEIKTLMPGTNLVQAKKIVESAPVALKTDLTKDEADQLVKALEAVGGKATVD